MLLRFSCGVLSGGRLGVSQLLSEYLRGSHAPSAHGHAPLNAALRLLSALDWNDRGQATLLAAGIVGVVKTVGRARAGLTPEAEEAVELALGLFYAPSHDLDPKVVDEYAMLIRDLSRRFFSWLVRAGRMAKAFQLAVDINDHDLFVDLAHAAQRNGHAEMAEAAMYKVGVQGHLPLMWTKHNLLRTYRNALYVQLYIGSPGVLRGRS
jgi:hypothetical protein